MQLTSSSTITTTKWVCRSLHLLTDSHLDLFLSLSPSYIPFVLSLGQQLARD